MEPAPLTAEPTLVVEQTKLTSNGIPVKTTPCQFGSACMRRYAEDGKSIGTCRFNHDVEPEITTSKIVKCVPKLCKYGKDCKKDWRACGYCHCDSAITKLRLCTYYLKKECNNPHCGFAHPPKLDNPPSVPNVASTASFPPLNPSIPLPVPIISNEETSNQVTSAPIDPFYQMVPMPVAGRYVQLPNGQWCIMLPISGPPPNYYQQMQPNYYPLDATTGPILSSDNLVKGAEVNDEGTDDEGAKVNDEGADVNDEGEDDDEGEVTE